MTANNEDMETDAAKLGSDGKQEAASAGRKLSPLSHLTPQSARFGVWEVAIFNPSAEKRE